MKVTDYAQPIIPPSSAVAPDLLQDVARLNQQLNVSVLPATVKVQSAFNSSVPVTKTALPPPRKPQTTGSLPQSLVAKPWLVASFVMGTFLALGGGVTFIVQPSLRASVAKSFERWAFWQKSEAVLQDGLPSGKLRKEGIDPLAIIPLSPSSSNTSSSVVSTATNQHHQQKPYLPEHIEITEQIGEIRDEITRGSDGGSVSLAVCSTKTINAYTSVFADALSNPASLINNYPTFPSRKGWLLAKRLEAYKSQTEQVEKQINQARIKIFDKLAYWLKHNYYRSEQFVLSNDDRNLALAITHCNLGMAYQKACTDGGLNQNETYREKAQKAFSASLRYFRGIEHTKLDVLSDLLKNNLGETIGLINQNHSLDPKNIFFGSFFDIPPLPSEQASLGLKEAHRILFKENITTLDKSALRIAADHIERAKQYYTARIEQEGSQDWYDYAAMAKVYALMKKLHHHNSKDRSTEDYTALNQKGLGYYTTAQKMLLADEGESPLHTQKVSSYSLSDRKTLLDVLLETLEKPPEINYEDKNYTTKNALFF